MVANAVLNFDLENYAAPRRVLIEEKLESMLALRMPDELWQAMRYSVLAGGKRMRALLCLAAAEAVGPGNSGEEKSASDAAIACACAIEMVHAMSLIHDDLPCMDNDDFRRGKPTNHKVYGEALALLAGDALLVYATEMLIRRSPGYLNPRCLLEVVAALQQAVGPEGMVGGQVADTVATGSCRLTELPLAAALESIHKRKTAALLRFSAWSGARLAGAEPSVAERIGDFGELLGLAFQIADDLLDVSGDMAVIGKTPGKDEASGKLTWVTVHGVEQAKRQLSELADQAKTLLTQAQLSEAAAAPLNALLDYAIHRTY